MLTSLSNFMETQALQMSTPNKQSPLLNGNYLNGETLFDSSIQIHRTNHDLEENNGEHILSLSNDGLQPNRYEEVCTNIDQQANHTHKSEQHSINSESNIIRTRLLNLLTNMIPHSERLTLRLLMNYTIDDKECQSIVIDEILSRTNKQTIPISNKNKLGQFNTNDLCFEIPRKRLRTTLSDPNPIDTTALDLSFHTDSDDNQIIISPINKNKHMFLTKNLKTKEFNKSPFGITNDDRLTSINYPSLPLGLLPNPNQNNSLDINTSIMSNLPSEFPLFDTPLLALLPLLQQQQQQLQQQQQQQQQNLTFTPLSTLNSNHSIQNNNEISDNLIINPLQSSSLTSNSNINLMSNLTGNLNQNLLNLNTNQSIIRFPLFNSFVQDQFNAVQALFSSNLKTTNIELTPISPPSSSSSSSSSLLATATNSITSDANITPITSFLGTVALSTPNITSLNLGSATLLNLKDKTTGLETVSIMPSNNKGFNQPVVSLLNQLSTSSAGSVSIRTVSNLSQLFNGTHMSVSNIPILNNNNKNNMGNDRQSNLNAINLFSSNLKMAPLSSSLNMADALANTITVANTTSLINNNNNKDNMGITLNTFNDTFMNKSTKDLIKSINSKLVANMKLPNAKKLKMEDNIKTNPNNTAIDKSSDPHPTNQFLFGRRLTHTRRFTCNQCRRNFSSLAELNKHTLETHNSFRCTICSAHFTQRSNLQRHSLKHVGFKPFTCNLCKKEYYRKDHLVRHIEVTHPTHDPKMNITVHLTSSECLDYLDRLHAGKQSTSPPAPNSIDTDKAHLELVHEDALLHIVEDEALIEEIPNLERNNNNEVKIETSVEF